MFCRERDVGSELLPLKGLHVLLSFAAGVGLGGGQRHVCGVCFGLSSCSSFGDVLMSRWTILFSVLPPRCVLHTEAFIFGRHVLRNIDAMLLCGGGVCCGLAVWCCVLLWCSTRRFSQGRGNRGSLYFSHAEVHAYAHQFHISFIENE